MPSYHIKTWEEILRTPGVQEFEGDIHGPEDFFVDGMRHFCGQVIETRSEVYKGHTSQTICDSWTIAYWMIVDPKSNNFKSLYERLL